MNKVIPARSSWRDLVKVHPAADTFPMMPEEELLGLSKDIEEHGLHDPIIFWTPLGVMDVSAKVRRGRAWPKEFYLLDGRNRLAAIDLLPDESRLLWCFDNFLDAPDTAYPSRTELLYAECDPWSYVVSANIHRRHLTSEDKDGLVVQLLKDNPGRSDRAIAKLTKRSHPKVASIRRNLVNAGAVENLSTRTDAAGRQQSATKPPRAPVVEPVVVEPVVVEPVVVEPVVVEPVVVEPAVVERVRGKRSRKPRRERRERSRITVSPSQVRDMAIVQFSGLLRAKPKETLDDLTRLLRDEQRRIVAEVPAAYRVALARGYLEAIGISLDDLKPIMSRPGSSCE